MKRYQTLSAAIALILAACTPVQKPVANAPTPAPTPTRRDSVWLSRRPTPPLLLPGYVFDSAGYVAAHTVPPFSQEPLIKWGPIPEGVEHAERVRTYDLQHQIINVQFDWSRHAVVGTTTLRIAALSASLKQVSFDAVGMQIKRVTNKKGVALKYTYDGNQIVVSLPTALRPATTTEITISYEAIKPGKGAYFVDRKHVVWTQGETQETRHWIPTYDYPNDKTTWEMIITTDTSEKALSNGRLVSSNRVGATTQWHWSLERPASTYLMSAVTGDYTILQDRHPTVPVSYWTYPDSVAAARRGFAGTPYMIDVFERKTGVKYPWAKYDQIVVPDFIFGGMENVTATTQNDQSILIPPSSAGAQVGATGLVSHELAHQWFGNLLTTASWGHIWLNEGFATFMESIYWEESKGIEEGVVDRISNQEAAIGADRGARRPLVFSRWQKDPIEVFFTGHIYPKGASVLQMLRRQLGDSVFWHGINGYVRNYSFKNVVSDNLREEMERASGRDLKPFFNQWVYGAGVPVFRVWYNYDSVTKSLTLTARQVQTRDSLTGFFDADVDIEVATDKGIVRGVMPVRGETSQLTLSLIAEPRSIRWDKGGWLLDVTDFPRPTTMLVHQLLQDDDIAGRIEAISLLGKRKGDNYAIAALTAASKDDKRPEVRVRAKAALSSMNPTEKE